MKENLVTVIVPVYKVEQYLDKCIDSLVNQTYQNLEIMLIDDGSPDNCPQMCDEWAKKDKRIKVIHKENGGQCSARNLALDQCKGDYICFVDSDDWVELNYVECLYKALIENDADISLCQLTEVYEDNRQPKLINNLNEYKIISRPELFPYSQINRSLFLLGPCNKLYKKYIFKNLRFPNIRMFEDSAIYPNIFHLANKVVTVPITLYNYLVRNQSTMHSTISITRYEAIVKENTMRLEFLEKNNYHNLIKNEVTRCINLCFSYYRKTKDKSVKKYIKSVYKAYLKKYKNVLNFWNSYFRLKIKMIYMLIF